MGTDRLITHKRYAVRVPSPGRLWPAKILAVGTRFKLANHTRDFKIDFENNQFLKDGEPFQYISGSLHYFRVPRVYWQDRLRKFRTAGLNAVSTYVEWSRHEPKPGVFDFTGENDLEYFIKLAEKEDLLVILRPGPYICAERDLGGYPVWLLHENPNMQLRTSDPSHTKYVKIWLDTLLSKLQHLLYGNGGPIIMVQVENEYGSYTVCDKNYKLWLRDLFYKHVSTKALLFTTDGAGQQFLRCGPIPGIFATVDFGSANVTEQFRHLRAIQPRGPLVNSEFYPGWLTHWGEPMKKVKTDPVVETTRQLLQANASFNYYVFFGGTNFGFTSGANYKSSNRGFLPQLTSYDYDAPITEAGDLTEKYFAIKSVISEFVKVPQMQIENSKKSNYGTLTLEPKTSLFDSRAGVSYEDSRYPKTFEELGLYSGFLLYETTLPEGFPGKGLLLANNVHDRAVVYINKQPVGVLERNSRIFSITISGEPHQPLGLLVENKGHINYGPMSDLKGLTNNVTVNGEVLVNWKQTGFPLDNVSHVLDLPTVSRVKMPAFYTGKFQLLDPSENPGDTFVDMSGWTKGIVYVNGHNLGRYWSAKGPQQSLFLPAPFLLKNPENNTIIVLELEKEDPKMSVTFSATPVWSST